MTAYLSFEAGGFFPGTVGVAAVVMALALVARLTLAEHPVAGWTGLAAAVAAAGALLASWTLVSALWSHSPVRAIVEFDRALLYVLVFAFYATFPRSPGTMTVLLRWVLLAVVAVAVAGLATRLYPGAFDAVPTRNPARLAFPLTYWNAMSVLCAVGMVLALHAATGGRQPAWVRVLATAALPVLALAVYFPFSRGGIAVAAIGLVGYAVLAHPRRLPFALVTAGPAVAVALHVAYGADALASTTYFEGEGPVEGRHVALVLGLAAAAAGGLRVLLLPLERRVMGLRIEPRRRRAGLAAALAVSLVVAAVAAVAFDAPTRAEAQYRGFVNGSVIPEEGDARERLANVSNNGRIDLWRVDRDAFEAEPWRGVGAGTYRLEWERERSAAWQAVDGHSLYLEMLAELGVVGLALLGVMLIGIVVALARRLRGPDRHAQAAALAAGGALLIHAGVDWDWEMPALLAWLFAAGGLAAARTPRGEAASGPPRLARVLAGLACLLLAVTPALVAASQVALDRGVAAFARGDCGTAVDSALDSLDALGSRPEPYELLGYCDLRGGEPDLAVRAMESAVTRDPENWQFAYGLAIAQALAGSDPRREIARARRLNPLEPLARDLGRNLRGSDPASWRRAAAQARVPSQ